MNTKKEITDFNAYRNSCSSSVVKALLVLAEENNHRFVIWNPIDDPLICDMLRDNKKICFKSSSDRFLQEDYLLILGSASAVFTGPCGAIHCPSLLTNKPTAIFDYPPINPSWTAPNVLFHYSTILNPLLNLLEPDKPNNFSLPQNGITLKRKAIHINQPDPLNSYASFDPL